MGKLYRVRKSYRRKKKRSQKRETDHLRRARYNARFSGPTTNVVVRVEKKDTYREVRNGSRTFRNALTNLYLEKLRGKVVGENTFNRQSDGLLTEYTLQNLPEKWKDWFITEVKKIFFDSFGEESTFLNETCQCTLVNPADTVVVVVC